MKYIYLILTAGIQMLLIWKWNPHSSLAILSVLIACAALGLIIKYHKKIQTKSWKELGWGLAFGSLTSIAAGISMLAVLALAFSD